MRPLAATSRNILKAKAMSDSSLIMPGEDCERGKGGGGVAWAGRAWGKFANSIR